MPSIVPVAKALIVCENYTGYPDGRVDLYSIFNSIRPKNSYPYRRERFAVFAQLLNGLGDVPFFIDIVAASTSALVWTTNTKNLIFPNRTVVVQLAMNLEGVVFPQPDLYLVQLYCDNSWVCETGILAHAV